MTGTPTATADVQAYPHSMFGVEAHVPITVELPRALVELLRWHYDRAADVDFADCLCDVIVFEPTYVVEDDGVEIDEDTGQPVDSEPNGGETE